jgi:phage antirepressor YoqD-like protein
MRNSEIVRTFKKRLVKAFYEMAQKQQSFDPATILESPEAMRGILLHYTERVIELEDVVKEQQPKVEALDRISTADGNLCITNAAKTLQVRPKDLFSAMSQHKWIYRRAGGKGWIGYQDKIQQGLITHKVTTVSLSDGTERIAEQVLVTPKGVAKLATILEAAA